MPTTTPRDPGKDLVERLTAGQQQLPPPKPQSKFTHTGPLRETDLTPRIIPRSNMEDWAYRQISQRQLGYTPTWAQNPRAITGAMQLIKATPKGQPLPTWIENQRDQIHQAYEWYKINNRGKTENEWKYLPADNAGMGWLATLQGPPAPEEIAQAQQPFSNKEAVLKGEAQWADLSPEERQAILNDKDFQISQYPWQIRDQILNDPGFDWSRVPAWQKTYWQIMSNPKIMAAPMALAGARAGKLFGPVGQVGGALLGYGLGVVGGQEYDPTGGVLDQPTVVAGMMAVLNKLSEGAEQSIGFSAEYIDAALAGAQGNKQAAESARKMLFDPAYRKATWEAGRFAYEASDFLGARNWMPALQLLSAMSDNSGYAIWSKEDRETIARKYGIQFAAPGQDFVIGQAAPVDRAVAHAINPVTGNRYQTNDPMGILQEIRLTIHKAIVDGEDPREVVRGFLGEQSQYVGAQVADFAGQMAIDPLEELPQVINTTSVRLASMLGNETAARAFTETQAPLEAARRYRTLVQSGDVPATFDYSAMGSMSRWVAGLNEKGEIRAGPFTQTGLLDAPSPAKRAGLINKFKEDLAALSPEARAQEGAKMFYDNLGTWLEAFDDPAEIAKRLGILSKGDFETWRAMGDKLGNSPQWYTILPILRDFKGETLDGLLGAWTLAAPKREALLKLANILAEEPGKFLDDLAREGTAQQDFVRLTQRLQQSASPEAKAFLDQITQGLFTADHLKDIVDAFTGDAALAWHPGQWKAQLLDALGAHADEWISEKLQLGKDPAASKAFFRTAHLLKSAQSVLLLGGSPGYALTNGLSNMVSRVITGNYGYMSRKQIDTWLERFGVTPARLEEGVGIGGVVEQASSRSRVQTEAIRRAVEGNRNDVIGRAQRAISAIGRGMPFNKLSSWFESVEGKNGYMIAMRDMWARTWRRGKGFREMTPQLRSAVEAAGINPGHIYNLIEAGMNKAEIERAIFGRQQGIKARSLVHNAAQQVGMTTHEAAAMLEKIGVLDQLDTLLDKASTPDAIRQAFSRARRTASDYSDMQTQRDLAAMAEQVTNKIGAEGAVAALDTVQQAAGEFFDAWFDHYARFGDLMGDLGAIPDPAQRSKAIELAYEQSDADFRRVMARQAAIYKGIFDAWKMEHHKGAVEFLHAIGEVDRTMRDAYAYMREARRQFFERVRTAEDPFAPEHTQEWKRVQRDIDKAFKDAFERKKQAEIRMGQALSVIYEQRYGPAAGAAARKWWEDYVKFADDIAKREQRFRRSIENLPKAEREAAKQRYYSTDKVAQIAELERINKEGIARLQRMIKRGKGPGAAATPQPTGPNPPEAPPGMAMSPEQALRSQFEMSQPRPTRAQVDAEVAARLEEQRHQPTEKELAEIEEANQLIAEAAQRDAQERIEKANHVRTVWDVAEGYWARGGNFNRTNFNDRFNLLGALRKAEYGGIPDLKDLGDPRLTPDVVRQILETRKAIKEAEAARQPTLAEIKAQEEAAAAAESARRQQQAKAQPYLKIDENTNMLQAIKWLGGINRDAWKRATGMSDGDLRRYGPGVFTKKGMGLDEMARSLGSEYKYPIDLTRVDDLDGVRQMTELVIEKLGNKEKVMPITHEASEKQLAAQEADWIERQLAEQEDVTVRATQEAPASQLGTPEAAMEAAAPPFDVAEWEARILLAAERDDLTALYDAAGEIPPELGTQTNQLGRTYNDWLSELIDDTVSRVQEGERMDDIAEELYQIEESTREMETRSNARMSARLLREKMQQAFRLTDAQADAYMELTETMARWYANLTGEDPDGFYSRYFADVRDEAEGGALFQDRAAPTWYHRSVQVVEAIKQESMTVDQLRGIINKGGVKADELKWTGLDDYLQGRTKVTKQEVLDHLRNNRVEVQEVVKQSDRAWDDSDPLSEAENTYSATSRIYNQERQALVAQMINRGMDRTRANEIIDDFIENDGEMPGDDTYADLLEIEMGEDDFADLIEAQEHYRTAQMDLDEAKEADKAFPKYEQYVLPGDYTNYREILLTLPKKDVQPVQPRPALYQDPSRYTIEVTRDNMQYYGQRDVRILYDGEQIGQRFGTRATDDEIISDAMWDHRKQAETEARESTKRTEKAVNYQSGHWDEPNVLAHTRLTERTDADGKRVLVIEEVQSDWHQQGREKGYKEPPFEGKLSDWIRKQGLTPEEFEKLPNDRKIDIEEAYAVAKGEGDTAAVIHRQNAMWKASEGMESLGLSRQYGTGHDLIFYRDGKRIATGDMQTGAITPNPDIGDAIGSKEFEVMSNVTRTTAEYRNALELNERSLRKSGAVPAAPFAKTWHELVMKRILRLAAEEGYDRVAWTTGQQQAVRWSQQLQQQADHLVYNKQFSTLTAFKGEKQVFSNEIHQDQLPSYVGDNVAKQLLETGEVKGEQIKVGGSGMHGFYDQILPSWANKYAKKWNARVGETSLEIHEGRAYQLIDEDGSIVEGDDGNELILNSRSDAEKIADEIGARVQPVPANRPGDSLHSIDVTDEMRRSVLEGQPLFQRAEPDQALIQRAVDAFGLTDDMEDAGFILPDGRMLDFKRSERDPQFEAMPHIQIIEAMPGRFPDWEETADQFYTPAVNAFINETGAMRIQRNGYFDELNVQITGEPTQAQIQLIRKELKGSGPDAHIFFDITDPDTGEIVAVVEGEATPSGLSRAFREVSEKVRQMETYYQKQGAGLKKGAVEFGPDGVQGTIKAFSAGDFSTAVHETFHIYRRVLADVADRTRNPQVMLDLVTIEEWAGVRQGEWTRAAEEKFARAWERYIAEGEAPLPKLQRAFENFKKWMLDIYRTIMGSSIDVQITPEVRAVFDRMLGAEQQLPTPERASQTGLFPGGEDLPLFSGAPQRAQVSEFRPSATRQEPLFRMAPEQPRRRSTTTPRRARAPGGQLDLPTPEAARVPATETPEFRQWFGNSKVVDDQGKPLVVYHGTNADFTEFELQSKSHGVDAAYFSDDPDTAASYAALGTLDEESPAAIMPTYLRMENPLVIDETGGERRGYKEFTKTVAEAKAAGHDGVIVKGALDDQGLRFGEEGIDWENFKTEEMVGSGEALPTNIYIVFDKNQIKSATGNKGQFSRTSPNILDQLAEAEPDQLPPVPEGHVRLYRGEAKPTDYKAPDWIRQERDRLGITDAAGRWFTDDLENARWYKAEAGEGKGKITYVDVPRDLAEAARLKNQPPEVQRYSRDLEREFYLSRDLAEQRQDTLYQIEPINRSMTPTEIGDYARALVRAGDDELRRAVQNEPNKRDRIAILDAAHQINPAMAEAIARKLPGDLFQIDVPGALEQLGGDRRNPAFQRLRQLWDHLDESSQNEVIDWILNQTLTDPLSGLETLVALAVEGGKPNKPDGWVQATSDLNALTAINNTWGHGAGDQLITVVGQIAKAEVAAVGGRAFRVGGDEFWYWFPDEEAARTALEAIDKKVSEQTVNVGGRDRKGFSISYGIGENPHSADTALYTDKLRRIQTGQRPEIRDQMPSSIQLIGEAPLGTMENAAGFTPESAWQDAGWRQHVDPLLDAMQNEALQQKPMEGASRDLTPEGQKLLRDYVSQVQNDMSAAKMSTIKWGESQRDFAMLNYNRRYGADKYLDAVVPYQFFATRTLVTSAMRAIDKPAMYAKYARLRNLQNQHERDVPERLRNKIKIAAPWLPDWMGDSLYVDPMQTLFAPANFLRPFEQMMRDKNMQQIETERVLQEWTQDGQVEEGEAYQAAASQSGTLWERAAAEAATRREAEIQNPFDFMSTILGPAWYLSTPLNMLGVEVPGISKGDRGRVTPTPLLNTTRAFESVTAGTWAEPVGKIIGAFGKPEQWIREKAKLPEFGQFGDYYVDRQLANMVADGLISPQQAQQAMVERQGELFDQARERVKLELAMRVPLAGATYAATHEGPAGAAQAFVPSLFGSGLLPAGELEYRGQKKEWDAAWKKYDAGDREAINKFFEKHPEYEAYLAKNKKPEDRLRSMLIGNIWDAYMELGETNKKQARAQMGQDFQMAFLDKETRNYESLDVQTLARWSQQLGALVPKTEETQPVIDQGAQGLDLYSSAITEKTDYFFNTRKEKYPDYHMLESGYYQQPRSQRAAYLLKFPRLKEYWNFKDDFLEKNPDLKPIISGKVFKRIDTSTWPAGLDQYVVTYAMTGRPMPPGATASLEQQWILAGQPLGDFKAWLDSQVAPAMLYQPEGAQ